MADLKLFGQVEGEYGDEQPEAEVQQKVGCQNAAVAGGNKTVFCHVKHLNGKKAVLTLAGRLR